MAFQSLRCFTGRTDGLNCLNPTKSPRDSALDRAVKYPTDWPEAPEVATYLSSNIPTNYFAFYPALVDPSVALINNATILLMQ